MNPKQSPNDTGTPITTQPWAADRTLPSGLAIFRAQLWRTVGGRRPGLWVVIGLILTQTLALAFAGVIFGVTISMSAGGKTETWIFSRLDSVDAPFPLDQGSAAVILVALAVALWAFLWPLALWSQEAPRSRGYHRSLPVAHREHALLRVAAGGLWLVLFAAGFIVLAVVVSSLAGSAAVLRSWSPWVWPSIVLGPLAGYLLMSALAVRSDHPQGWFWGGLGTLSLLSSLAAMAGWQAPQSFFATLLLGRFGLFSALGGPVVMELQEPGSTGPGALLPLALWLVVGLVALLFATIPRDAPPARAQAVHNSPEAPPTG